MTIVVKMTIIIDTNSQRCDFMQSLRNNWKLLLFPLIVLMLLPAFFLLPKLEHDRWPDLRE